MDTQTTGIYLTLLTGLVFLTGLLALFIHSIFRHQQQRLKEYKRQVGREIALIDKERQRISADLHDELGSGLASIGLLLQQVAGNYSNPLLQKANTHIEQQRKKISEISHDLVSPLLQSGGLGLALTDLAEEISAAGRVRIRIQLQMNDALFEPATVVHIYRIVREILTNAIKHAQASEIRITCKQDDTCLSIRLADNGSGFDTKRIQESAKGFGMQHIRSRIGLLQASLTFDSLPGNGTRYHIKIPLPTLMTHGKQP